MSEWVSRPLGKLISYISKGIPPKYTDKTGTETIRVLNQKCNRNFEIDYSEARLHDATKKAVPAEKMVGNGDVLINSTGTGTAGRVAQIMHVDEPTTVDGHMIILRPTDEIDPAYFGYATKNHQPEIEQLAEGSTGQTEINRKRLCDEIIIEYPQDKKDQEKISRLLSDIDEKMRVNAAINHCLEEQCFALYQNLFVVNAKPEWKVGTISDLGNVVGGSTPSKTKPEYYCDRGMAWITPKDLSVCKDKFISHGLDDITSLGLKNSSAQIMPRGTVLFSSRAPIGYIAIARNEVCTNQGFKSVVPVDSIGTAYVYYYLRDNLPMIEGRASGSTFKEVSGSTMKSIPAVIPDTQTLRVFAEFCSPIFGEQELLEVENAKLTEVRDLLLPKLMSGEIDVSDVDI